MNSFYRAVSLAAIFWTTVSMSAYTPHETGSRTTASGAKAKEGYTCAANFVPLGSVIIYEGHRYYVQDRMNPNYNRHVDLFMESHKKAIEFGRKEAKVQVITQDDKPLKNEKVKNEKKKAEVKKQKETKKTKMEIKKETKKQDSSITKTAQQSVETKIPNQPHNPQAPTVLKPQARP